MDLPTESWTQKDAEELVNRLVEAFDRDKKGEPQDELLFMALRLASMLVDALRDADDWKQRALKIGEMGSELARVSEQRDAVLRTRVAELEAQLAARP